MIQAATTVDFGNPIFLGGAATVIAAIGTLILGVVRARPENTRAIAAAATDLVTASVEFTERVDAQSKELRAANATSSARMSELEAALHGARDDLGRVRRQYEDNIADLARQVGDRDAQILALEREVAALRAQLAAAQPPHTA